MRASSQASLPLRRTAVLVRRAAEKRDPWERPSAERQVTSAGEDTEGREPVCAAAQPEPTGRGNSVPR